MYSQFGNFMLKTTSATSQQCLYIFMRSVISGSWQIRANCYDNNRQQKTTALLLVLKIKKFLWICFDLTRGLVDWQHAVMNWCKLLWLTRYYNTHVTSVQKTTFAKLSTCVVQAFILWAIILCHRQWPLLT